MCLAWNLWFRSRTSTGAILLSVVLLSAVFGVERNAKGPLFFVDGGTTSSQIAGVVIDSGDQRLLVKIDSVEINNRWYRESAVVHVYGWADAPPDVGEKWVLAGEYNGYGKPHAGISGTFRVDTERSGCLHQSSFSVRARLSQLRMRAGRFLSNGLESFPERILLLRALLLGERNQLPEDWHQLFAHTGTLHVFAISGLHVGVVASIFIAALKILGVPRPRWGLFLIPLLLGYVLMTGMKASALRAFAMAAVYFSAPLFRRKPDPVTAIAVAALILLIIQPQQLGDPGFILSFTVVSGIVMVHQFVRKLQSGLRPPAWTSPLASLHSGHPGKELARVIGLMAVTSVAAWLFAFPLSARLFNTFSPVAVIGNLFLVPVVFLIVLSGFLSMTSGAFLLPFSVLLNEANGLLVGALIKGVELLHSLPGAYSFVRAPSWLFLILWYGGLIILFCGSRYVRRPGLLMILIALGVWFAQGKEPAPHIQVFRDGEHAVFVSSPEQDVLMVDGSPYSLVRAGRMLKKKGVNRLDHVWVMSHVSDTKALGIFCSTFGAVPEFGEHTQGFAFGGGTVRPAF